MVDVRDNHVAISMPSREAWLKQLAWLRSKGVKFERRVNHGMTHSLYIVDPNGYGVEVLYDSAPGSRRPNSAVGRKSRSAFGRRPMGRRGELL